MGRDQSLLQTQVAGKEGCHHSALFGLTSRTHSFNKYLLSAYLCKALPQGAVRSPSHAPSSAPSGRVVGFRRAAWPRAVGPSSHQRVQPPRRRARTPAQLLVTWSRLPWRLPASPFPVHARRYAQRAQPHLVGFSTSSAKEVPSLHSKVNFLRFSRRPWQQPWPGHNPRHSTHDSGRVVWQMA